VRPEQVESGESEKDKILRTAQMRAAFTVNNLTNSQHTVVVCDVYDLDLSRKVLEIGRQRVTSRESLGGQAIESVRNWTGAS
jgi:hypothetical protein